jgi:hypothetical protein
MTATGRNDPCPCGSGKKSRDCCGGDETRLMAMASSVARDSAIAKLLTFAFQPAFDNDHAVAEIVFWGDLLRDPSVGEIQWLMESEDANIKYNTWFLFDWEVDGAGTVADLFLEDEAARLSQAERRFLSRLAGAQLRLYEVESVDRGYGLSIVDLWTGDRMFVIERTATTQIVRWDVLGARVAPDGLGGLVFEGGLYLYPAESKDQILTHFRKLYRRHHRKSPSDDVATFFRKHGMVFHHLWLSLVAFPAPPLVTTSEGHTLIFCRVVFDTGHVEEVRNTLTRQENIRMLDDGRLSWRERSGPAPDEEHDLGTFTFEKTRVVFETTSQERALKGRMWLERLVGDLVRFRATALETVEQAMNELRRQRPLVVPEEHGDVDTGPVTELYDRHYHTWLDRPVPALGNRTPRAAAQTKMWRPRLIDLLKRIENGAERAALMGRPPYDFSWIWKELGLDRPAS